MKKVNSFKNLATPNTRAWSPVRSPLSSPRLESKSRSRSTTSVPAVTEEAQGTGIDAIRVGSQTIGKKSTVVSRCRANNHVATTYETVPEHDEAHVGPYGVEMPREWEFVVVTVREVMVEVANDAEAKQTKDTAVPKDSATKRTK